MTSTSNWIIHSEASLRTRLRLFCFPYAGGGASIYRQWQDQLSPDIEVCPVQLPGREKRRLEPAFTHVTPLVESLLQVLPDFLDLPYAFFGHSMGALISFELARQLRKQRYPQPIHLFVSSRRPPHIQSLETPIHQLPDQYFLEELCLYDGMPEGVLKSPEITKFFLPLLRADFAIHETYSYTPEIRLRCPITAFGGLQDRKVKSEDLSGWREQTSNNFKLHIFPGNHLYIRHAFPEILSVITKDLSQTLVQC